MISEAERLAELCHIENTLRAQGYTYIAGVDEAGRGPLAGPVVAAACILPPDLRLEGVDDSKKLTPSQRQHLYHILTTHPQISYGIGIVDAECIDRINILQATLEAMRRAIEQLSLVPNYLLVDGKQMPHVSLPGQALVKGDARCQAIAAASNIAKVKRDGLMENFHAQWPWYNFIENKGYGTREHLQALREHGPCPIHRMSFAPLRNA